MDTRMNYTPGPRQTIAEHPVEDAFDAPVEPYLLGFEATDEEFEDDTILSSVVYKPSHYTQYTIEPITFIMLNGFDFWRGNIIKYASRAGSKLYPGMDEVDSEITDLEKVRRYAEMRINQLKGQEVL